MTNLMKKAQEIRLLEESTPEMLEENWSCVLTFGSRVLVAGYFSQGWGKHSFFGAVYEFTTRDHSIEGAVKLVAISDEYFEDNGHAIAWAMGL